jgi:predicted phage-related endonuclease
MTQQLLDFWYNNVVAKKAPEPQNSEDVARKFLHVENDKILDIAGNTTIINTCYELLGVKQQLKPLEEKEKKLSEEIKMCMKDSTILMAGDQKLVTWKQARDSVRFDDKALLEAEPELYKKYLYTVIGSRRFLLSMKEGE